MVNIVVAIDTRVPSSVLTWKERKVFCMSCEQRSALTAPTPHLACEQALQVNAREETPKHREGNRRNHIETLKRRKSKLNERRSLILWGFRMHFPAFYSSSVRGESTENEEEQSNDFVICKEMFRHPSSFGFN